MHLEAMAVRTLMTDALAEKEKNAHGNAYPLSYQRR
jgi:hypothetical protein